MTTQKKLTNKTIAGMDFPASGRVTVQDTEDRYLHIVLNPTTKSWRYIRKVKGRVVFMTLGRYPDMTPAQARQQSRLTSAGYARGEDPAKEKRDGRKVTTWGELFEWYMEDHAKLKKRTWEEDKKQNDLYCAGWKNQSLSTLDRAFIKRWHRNIGKKRGKFAADRTLATVKSIFNRAIDEGKYSGENPAVGVELFHKSPEKYSRTRFMDAEEMARFLAALDAYPDQDMADFFRLCLFTGARRGNVQAMKWAHLHENNATWVIPGSESKSGKEVRMPILPPAGLVLNRRKANRKSEVYVFPAKRKGGSTPHMTEPKKAWAAICTAAKIEDLRIHDLRRTLGSWMAMDNASLAVIGKALGHSNSKTTEIYARMNLDPVRLHQGAAVTKMMQAVNGKAGEGGE